MAELYRVDSPITREQRNNLNNTFSDIRSQVGKVVLKVTEAKDKVDGVQEQINTIVVNGDSSVEAAQARVSENGTVYPTLKERLDTENESLVSEKDRITEEIKYVGINVLFPPIPLEGCKGDGTDDTSKFEAIVNYAKNNKTNVIIPETDNYYNLARLQGVQGVNFLGVGMPRIELNGDQQVIWGISSDTEVSNLHIKCVVESRNFIRGDATSKSNILIKNCKIEGFRHNIALPNAWGIYLDKSKNVVIENCIFEDNSQSDIAIVEGCENIDIINASGSMLHLNIEPNTYTPQTNNVRVTGGKYNRITLRENSNDNIFSDKIFFSKLEVNELSYNGANAYFDQCKINRITGNGLYAGDLKILGSVQLGVNLLKDPFLNDVSNNETNKFWYVSPAFSLSNNLSRQVLGNLGRSLIINPNNQTTFGGFKSKNIEVEGGKSYVFNFLGYAVYGPGVLPGKQLRISEYDSSNNLLKQTSCAINRDRSGKPRTSSCVFVTNVDTTNLTIELALSIPSTGRIISMVVKSMELREILENKDNNFYEDTNDKFYINGNPQGLNAVGGSNNLFLKGDILYNSDVSLGSYEKFACVTAGNPGTWVGVNQIGVRRGPTSERPTGVSAGYRYLDTSLNANGREITYTGSSWVDSTGAVV